jgi:hypothetical protein
MPPPDDEARNDPSPNIVPSPRVAVAASADNQFPGSALGPAANSPPARRPLIAAGARPPDVRWEPGPGQDVAALAGREDAPELHPAVASAPPAQVGPMTTFFVRNAVHLILRQHAARLRAAADEIGSSAMITPEDRATLADLARRLIGPAGAGAPQLPGDLNAPRSFEANAPRSVGTSGPQPRGTGPNVGWDVNRQPEARTLAANAPATAPSGSPAPTDRPPPRGGDAS